MRSPAASGWAPKRERGTTSRFTATAMRPRLSPSDCDELLDGAAGRNIAGLAVDEKSKLCVAHGRSDSPPAPIASYRRRSRGCQTGAARCLRSFDTLQLGARTPGAREPQRWDAGRKATDRAPDAGGRRSGCRARELRRGEAARRGPQGHRRGEGGRLRPRRDAGGAQRWSRPAASRLAVLSVEEGCELREAGLELPILVLGGVHRDCELALERGLTPVLHHAGHLERVAKLARRRGERVAVHVEVDTGMRRMGVPPDEAEALLAGVAAEPALRARGRLHAPRPGRRAGARAQPRAARRLPPRAGGRARARHRAAAGPLRELAGAPGRPAALRGAARGECGAARADALRRASRAAPRGRAAAGHDAAHACGAGAPAARGRCGRLRRALPRAAAPRAWRRCRSATPTACRWPPRTAAAC